MSPWCSRLDSVFPVTLAYLSATAVCYEGLKNLLTSRINNLEVDIMMTEMSRIYDPRYIVTYITIPRPRLSCCITYKSAAVREPD